MEAIIGLLAIVIAGLVGALTKSAMSYLNKKGIIAKIESNKVMVDIVVNAIEQGYKGYSGEEKLELAKGLIIKYANEQGLKISEVELNIIIESSVKSMKEAIKSSK